MTFHRRARLLLTVVLGVASLLAPASRALAQRGAKIDIDDDPSIKEGSPDLVLVEIADFQ